jgi:adenosylcobinamide amidohydrolase
MITLLGDRTGPDREGPSFEHRIAGDALIISFSRPLQVMSWSILHGGFRPQTAHIINQHMSVSSQENTPPETSLRQAVSRLGLRGTVVGMMTAANVRRYSFAKTTHDGLNAYALATARCSNLASVGDQADFMETKDSPRRVGTINLILVVNYKFTHEAMLEAMAIATEAKVKALFELGLRSSTTGEPATGTGTDCVAIATGFERRYHFCGKDTKWGELIGRVSLDSLRAALRGSNTGTGTDSR